MTQLTREEFTRNTLLQFKEPEDARKEPRAKQFILLWVLLGAVVGGFITLLVGEPKVFLPAWGTSSVFLWAFGSSWKEEK